MSLYTQSVGSIPRWLNDLLKVEESQKQELWIKSVVAQKNCELIYNEIFCANAKNLTEGWRRLAHILVPKTVVL
jgi:hypothetical protein